MRILVTGSRDWEDENVIFDKLEEQYHCWEHEDCGIEYVIVSGACPTGADALCEKWARVCGYKIERHPADWEKHGKRAGFVRNAEMVELGADICLAFIRNGSKGATMTADLAEKAGIPTERYIQND